MSDIKFRVWHKSERKMYFRGYQKWSHVLLCEDDRGKNGGKGLPIKRAQYEDCILLQSTTLEDIHGYEIFEGDILRIQTKMSSSEGALESVPDMFKSRKLHPLDSLLKMLELKADDILSVEIVGNRFKAGNLLERKFGLGALGNVQTPQF